MDAYDAFETFWREQGAEVLELIHEMNKRESWALDAQVGNRIDLLLNKLKTTKAIDLGVVDKADTVVLLSWMSSSKSMVILRELENIRPGLSEELITIAQPLGPILKVFLERISVFSATKMLLHIFNVDRIRLIEQEVANAMNRWRESQC